MGLGVYEGVAAIRGFFEDWIGSYDEIELGGEELLDLGSGIGCRYISGIGHPKWSRNLLLAYAQTRRDLSRFR